MHSEVSAVDDTARWVAHQRAVETARSDALFRDAFAERLAGARGRAIAERAAADGTTPGGDAWYLVTRTVLIDRAVTAAVANGIDQVINIGAGLDTRPYRMDLPPGLAWTEIDLPAVIDEKTRMLAAESPRCALHRVALDLADADLAGLLAQLDARRRRTLVLSEGLIMYLTPQQADSLTNTLVNSGTESWCLDLSAAGVGSVMQQRNRGILRRAPWLFLPPNGVAYFEDRGWTAERIEPIFPAAVALGRLDSPEARDAAAGPQPNPRDPGDVPFSAVVTFRA